MNLKIQSLSKVVLLSLIIIIPCKGAQKPQKSQNGSTFYNQSNFAAPMAGTQSDTAAAQYYAAQANSLKNNNYYQVLQDSVSVINRDYLAPTVQPSVAEFWQEKVHKTAHQQRMEEKEKLEIENLKIITENHKASSLQTRLNIATAQQQMLGNSDKDKALKEENAKTLKQINDIHKKSIDDWYNQEFGAEEQQKSSKKTPSNNSSSQNSKRNTDTKQIDSSKTPEKSDGTKTDATQDQNNKEAQKGLLTKLGAILCPPIVLSGIDTLAHYCGPKKAAEWLANNTALFKDKEIAVSMGITATGTLAVLVALYTLYDVIMNDDDDDEDDDIFKKFDSKKT